MVILAYRLVPVKDCKVIVTLPLDWTSTKLRKLMQVYSTKWIHTSLMMIEIRPSQF